MRLAGALGAAMKGVDVGLDRGICGLEKLVRGEVGDEAAFVHQHDAVGEIEGFVEVVGDQEDGFSHAREESLEHVLHFGAGEGIEGSKGLVHEQDLRVGSESAGQADALALAAGELVRVALRKSSGIEADVRQELVAAFEALGSGLVLNLENQADVAFDVEVGEEAGFLNDVADAAAKGDEVGGTDGLAENADLAGGGFEHAVGGTHQGGLAGTAAAEDGSDGALLNRE